jgi:tetratricopeptide (TPR) repeat protein
MGVFQYNTSSIGYRIKKKRRFLLLGAIISAVVLALMVFILANVLTQHGGASGPHAVSKTKISKEWTAGNFQSVYNDCSESLAVAPTDSYYLVMSGFSSFYLALSQVSDEEKVNYLNQSVSSLRKALLHPSFAMRTKIEYILGKAYYHLGYYFMDESVYYLEKVSKAHYGAKDTDEYLALAYAGLGENGKSLTSYQKCIEKNPTDGLYLAAADVLVKLNMLDMAQDYLNKAISLTKDAAIEERARFALASIYMQNKDYSLAEKQYSDIISKNDGQSDAYFQLGLIAEIGGDVALARSQWRKALKADPMNEAARNKLLNRPAPKEDKK